MIHVFSRPGARLLVGAIALASLAGCGLTGDLQRPEPLIGNPADRGAAELPDRDVERGLPDADGPVGGTEADGVIDDDLPDAEDELLGGPGAG